MKRVVCSLSIRCWKSSCLYVTTTVIHFMTVHFKFSPVSTTAMIILILINLLIILSINHTVV